mmetsp:Transcript_6268/g.15521  ORF Transcript_6268/g.15521 Transcript_6268/m.15521 type:complete len:191 (+) Transcript_6268:94-666(+)|eukprot:CAMPEP_0197192622 /NCGR_PEP_ID=MMETSP1423-20130617/25355_1 /TAXON_ID=476441 /ORGANISM="Pseudo-nitzschia heimii, Strain UNC1101" /LENGTH=190 /DNA_ID=CAMNT_0042645543 /DNA_START=23 /DNA_END=595 /DNA_ORIENTATION=+
MNFKSSVRFDNIHRTLNQTENTNEGAIATIGRRSCNNNDLDVLGGMDEDLFSPRDDAHAPIPLNPTDLSPMPINPSSKLSSAQVFDRPDSAKNYEMCTAGIPNLALLVSSKANNTNRQVFIDMTSGVDDEANDIDDDLSAAEFHPQPIATPMLDAKRDIEFDDDLSLAEFQPSNVLPSPSPLKMNYGIIL